MTGQELIARGFRVSVHPFADAVGNYRVLYSERGMQQVRGNNGEFPRVPPPSIEALVRIQDDTVQVHQSKPYSDITLADFEVNARSRAYLVDGWLGRLSSLINDVERWAKDLGWSTRLIQKRLEDSQIGQYEAPALLLQEGTARILLEPVGRSSIGTEGVVDLYLMPAYDDIASLFFYDGRWNLHYATSTSPVVATVREAPSKPLSKETLQEVLEEMKQNAV